MSDEPGGYELLDLERVLAEDARTSELQVHLSMAAGRLVVSGRVATRQRRDQVFAILHEHCGSCPIDDELGFDEDTLTRVPLGRETIEVSR